MAKDTYKNFKIGIYGSYFPKSPPITHTSESGRTPSREARKSAQKWKMDKEDEKIHTFES
ncbi:hypothetical protein H5410_040282 [Solanum commersonii]|uniref:Uncharacterized protein n=1 Tax=Solanum commersonii TaxID=4109 RepID=A0A9J5XRL8_SOLCO|nr:hypothetical protein H5410_040282 [Solanum commersonii]